MSLALTESERAIADGREGEAARIALRIVADTGRVLGARRLIPVASAHIDGGLYHGDSGTEFAEFMVKHGARVRVPATMNVGALDLGQPNIVRLDDHPRNMARRLMTAYQEMGCEPTWTCSPYQAGHRPALGQQVAWGESNAVVFCNSVLGARTNRYGDYLDIACAIIARAPEYGLHIPANRRATIVVSTQQVSAAIKASDPFWPVLGAWLGRNIGNAIAAIEGLEAHANEDRLKALGAAAAAFGEVALFHIVGVTPEARDRDAALQAQPPENTIELTTDMLRGARRWLSTTTGQDVSAIAIGSPHLSVEEFQTLLKLLRGRKVALPFYANTGRHVVAELERSGQFNEIKAAGITLVVDTCVVVTPILDAGGGVLMTNSGKFACYAPGNTGYDTLYGSIAECVETAVAGRFTSDPDSAW